MTYFEFLLRFLVIPIIIFLAITWWDNKNNRPTLGFQNGRAVWVAILVHVLLAVTYTTPWDNYLVATGVWYYNPDLVTGIVFGYVPIEEYTFFVVETILAGLWWWFLARRISPLHAGEGDPQGRVRAIEAGKRLIVQNQPAVGAGGGLLVLDEVQPAGKKPMSGKSFLSGARNWES